MELSGKEFRLYNYYRIKIAIIRETMHKLQFFLGLRYLRE